MEVMGRMREKERPLQADRNYIAHSVGVFICFFASQLLAAYICARRVLRLSELAM